MKLLKYIYSISILTMHKMKIIHSWSSRGSREGRHRQSAEKCGYNIDQALFVHIQTLFIYNINKQKCRKMIGNLKHKMCVKPPNPGEIIFQAEQK